MKLFQSVFNMVKYSTSRAYVGPLLSCSSVWWCYVRFQWCDPEPWISWKLPQQFRLHMDNKAAHRFWYVYLEHMKESLMSLNASLKRNINA